MSVKAECSQQGGKAGLKIENIANQFYINDYFTTKYKIFFKSVRTIATEKHFKYGLVQGGNILGRKDDK